MPISLVNPPIMESRMKIQGLVLSFVAMSFLASCSNSDSTPALAKTGGTNSEETAALTAAGNGSDGNKVESSSDGQTYSMAVDGIDKPRVFSGPADELADIYATIPQQFSALDFLDESITCDKIDAAARAKLLADHALVIDYLNSVSPGGKDFGKQVDKGGMPVLADFTGVVVDVTNDPEYVAAEAKYNKTHPVEVVDPNFPQPVKFFDTEDGLVQKIMVRLAAARDLIIKEWNLKTEIVLPVKTLAQDYIKACGVEGFRVDVNFCDEFAAKASSCKTFMTSFKAAHVK